LTTAAALANNIQDIEIDLLLEGVYRAHGFDFREYSRASIKRRVLEMMRAERYDLVLLDILLPEMNGFQVLQEIQADETLRTVVKDDGAGGEQFVFEAGSVGVEFVTTTTSDADLHAAMLDATASEAERATVRVAL